MWRRGEQENKRTGWWSRERNAQAEEEENKMEKETRARVKNTGGCIPRRVRLLSMGASMGQGGPRLDNVDLVELVLANRRGQEDDVLLSGVCMSLTEECTMVRVCRGREE